MAEKIIVDIVLSPKSENKAFSEIEKDARIAGNKTAKNFDKSFSSTLDRNFIPSIKNTLNKGFATVGSIQIQHKIAKQY